MRVRELATELRVDHSEVMAILKEKGYELANYMANMNDAQVELVRKAIRSRKSTGATKQTAVVPSEARSATGSKVVRRGASKKPEEAAELEPTVVEAEPAPAPRTRITKKAPPPAPEPVSPPPDEPAPVESHTPLEQAEAPDVAAEPSAEGAEAGRPGGARIIKTGVRIHIPQRNQPRDRGGYGAGAPRRGPGMARPSMPMAPMPAASPAPSDAPSSGEDDRRKKAKEVKHPKRRVINKVDKYRHILTEGTANLRARRKTKKDDKDGDQPITAPMSAHKRKIRI